jgi:uncharacterized membrane protein YoaT (DUF817 family)
MVYLPAVGQRFFCCCLWGSFGIPRYDFLLAVCVGLQIWMVWGARSETIEELKTITLFHGLAMAMEIYKVNLGSWTYPSEAYTKLWGVPLFAGFMYAAVGSYLTQLWRRFAIELVGFPAVWINVMLGLLIYINFFTNGFWPDIRWVLFAVMLLVYRHSQISFYMPPKAHRIPLLGVLVGIGLLIWIAENIGTFLELWQYPHQLDGWEMVGVSKIGSWVLLCTLSVILVALRQRNGTK